VTAAPGGTTDDQAALRPAAADRPTRDSRRPRRVFSADRRKRATPRETSDGRRGAFPADH